MTTQALDVAKLLSIICVRSTVYMYPSTVKSSLDRFVHKYLWCRVTIRYGCVERRVSQRGNTMRGHVSTCLYTQNVVLHIGRARTKARDRIISHVFQPFAQSADYYRMLKRSNEL